MQNIWNFQIFFCFMIPLLYTKFVLSLWPSAYCHCPEYISYFFTFFDFKSDMMRLCNEQKIRPYTYFPKKVPVCGTSDVLIQF